MKQHTYRVTLEHISDATGQPSAKTDALVFEARNHDDIFTIVEKMKGQFELTEQQSIQFAVGMKLFSEIMLENRQNPLFSELGPQFGQFMKKLKSEVRTQATGNTE